jgi:hypothetical protein
LLERQLDAMERLAAGAQAMLVADEGELVACEYRRVH